ncbi:unnamed protein product [Hymenolepis diminuta]|uniref:Uncharacterized protein n=1 Tax=Hymenolepis diminuta TaxID=6216 RepID=A0A564Y4F9_HYMDI|nr:unnamed protein product [Hymenolepis diminuta]
MRTQNIIFVIVLFIAISKVSCSPSLLNTQDVTAEHTEKMNKENNSQNPGSGNTGENNSQNPGSGNTGGDNSQNPGSGNTGGDDSQQPGDDKTSSTSTTSKSSHLSYGFAASFSSLIISFVFYI